MEAHSTVGLAAEPTTPARPRSTALGRCHLGRAFMTPCAGRWDGRR